MIHASPTQKWLPLLGIAAIAALVCMAVGWRAHAPTPAPHAPKVAEDLTTLDAGARMQQAIAEVKRVQPEERAVATMGKVPMLPQEIIEKSNEAARQKVAKLDAWYYSMPANSQWADSSKADVDSLVNSDIPQVSHLVPRAYKSDCRDHACRMEASLNGASAEDWADIVNAGLSQSLPRTHMVMLYNSDGTTTVVMYAMASGITPHI